MTKALGARDLSPLARLLTTENFFIPFYPWVNILKYREPAVPKQPAFPAVSDAYDLYVGFIFKNSKPG